MYIKYKYICYKTNTLFYLFRRGLKMHYITYTSIAQNNRVEVIHLADDFLNTYTE